MCGRLQNDVKFTGRNPLAHTGHGALHHIHECKHTVNWQLAAYDMNNHEIMDPDITCFFYLNSKEGVINWQWVIACGN